MQDYSALRDAIRDVVDFPKEGIIFKDIMPMLAQPELLKLSVQAFCETAAGQKIDKVVGIDARGFIFGSAVAMELGAGFVPIRKKGKLPWMTNAISYSLEYGEATVEIHQDSIKPGERVLIVDDLLATGGTAAAAVSLVQSLDADLVGISFLIELEFLNGRQLLPTKNIHSIIQY
ncbi:adenine phosphoribosyltransferase [Persicirhabdus sediminis]|uniref:Adenine phosphoribosyltransferase n=1 Tax=Persicirhabdus sediminis TaxID=454144 RepID=A0A8J7MCD9_9BACT|nr:adenine phosphoribosyltransferase [Persicirhabdus sediminis]MBK1791079.1 adenine phosphoribosyltransferase [Persicirhabdus sediminis]